ncbi:MAG: tetratricopeptide repeat protein [Ruminococcaceae bacterium]|nr:tetratricopeptide repeat protein [Oscillospiraceae bacterium]
MAEMLFKTKGNGSPQGKARVYFTCHKDDFDLYFEQVCEYIFKSHDCAVYYTADMNEVIDEADKATDLESNNLFVVPVTFKLLSTENRAMDDVRFAFDKHIPVLPLMMESGLDAIYSRPDKFGELQYLSSFSSDATEVSFAEKLKKYLESVLVSDEMAKRVRAAFDAYIFLSYRKKDRKYANQLMRIIHSKPECRDIAIWYDEFLTPGESFRENIDKILADSKLFTLLVTPNLLEEHNFVMEQEYPAAVKSGIEILPAEMEETDKNILAEKYANLPEISNPNDDEAFRKRLAQSIEKIATSANDDDPEHNFLIGLAYLDGIDVEVNRERALELITKAAKAKLPEAMEKLVDMYYNGSGVKVDFNNAIKWSEKLMNHNLKVGIINKSLIRSMLKLSNLYTFVGKIHAAIELSEKAYSYNRKVFGDEDYDTLHSLISLSILYISNGENNKAIEFGEKCYSTTLKVYGEEDPFTLCSLSVLSACYKSIDNYPKAIETGEKAYLTALKTLGEANPFTLQILTTLTSVYGSAGNYTKAIEFSEKAYVTAVGIFGEEHPNTLISLLPLAICYYSNEDYPKIIELCEKAYLAASAIPGNNGPSFLTLLDILSESYRAIGNISKAIECYEKAYPICIKIHGQDHPDTLELLDNLASAYKSVDNDEKSAELYNNALSSLSSLAEMYSVLHNYPETIDLYEKTYSICVKAFGEENATTIDHLRRLAETYSLAKNNAKATELYDKLYQLCVKVYGKDHEITFAVSIDLLTSSFPEN